MSSDASRGPSWRTFYVSQLITIGVSLAVAFIGYNASTNAADRAYEAAVDTEKSRQVAAEDEQTREKRATVYAEYLRAADAFSVETNRIRPNKTAKPDSIRIHPAWDTARGKLQDATNELSVYGSDEAWVAHRAIAAEVPSSLGSSFSDDDGQILVDGTDSDAFLKAYREFLDVVCFEVPANPRRGCADD